MKRELRLRYLLYRLRLKRGGATLDDRLHRMLTNALNFGLASLTLYQQEAPPAVQGPAASKHILAKFLGEWNYRLSLKKKMMRVMATMEGCKQKFKAVVE